MNEIQQAKKQLELLIAERDEIKRKLEEAEGLKKRLKDLEGHFGQPLGRIERAARHLRDVQYPIYDSERNWGVLCARRIIAIDDKWISLRHDGCTAINRYKLSTGWKMGCRNKINSIDPTKARAIWENHKKEGENATRQD